MRPGYLYALSNRSMPDLIKVGCTTRSPFDRARELRSTGVPHPFVVLAAVAVPDIDTAEAAAFARLSGRVDGREFFRTSLREVLTVFTTLTEAQDQAPAAATSPELALLEQARVWHHGAGTVAPDLKRAAAAYAEAASAGSIDACRILAGLYAGGQGLRRSPEKVQYYAQRAEALTHAQWQTLSAAWPEHGARFVTALQEGDHHLAYLLAAQQASVSGLSLVRAQQDTVHPGGVIDAETLRAAYQSLPFTYKTLALDAAQWCGAQCGPHCTAEQTGGSLLAALDDAITLRTTASRPAYVQGVRWPGGDRSWWAVPYAELIRWCEDQDTRAPKLTRTHAVNLRSRLMGALT